MNVTEEEMKRLAALFDRRGNVTAVRTFTKGRFFYSVIISVTSTDESIVRQFAVLDGSIAQIKGSNSWVWYLKGHRKLEIISALRSHSVIKRDQLIQAMRFFAPIRYPKYPVTSEALQAIRTEYRQTRGDACQEIIRLKNVEKGYADAR